MPITAGVLTGKYSLDSRRVRFELRRRQARFRLEVDSAGWLNPVAGTLASLFQDARFVLTLRDCFSWLDSRVEAAFELQQPAGFSPMGEALSHAYPSVFALEEAPLRDAGFRPVASYLQQWAEWNTSVLRDVPSDRLLVVRTEDLSDAADALARFAGVPVGTVQPAHANANVDRARLLSQIPREFIVERAQEHCAAVMERYWAPTGTTFKNDFPYLHPHADGFACGRSVVRLRPHPESDKAHDER